MDCGFSIVDEIVTKRVKLGEEAMLGTINEIIRDNGSLFREYVINEDFIINALKKQIPVSIEEHNKQCSCRAFDYMDFKCTKPVPYCCVCGQKIKW